MSGKQETRDLRGAGIELRRKGGKAYAEGLIPYNSPSEDLGGFREKIAPSAFMRTLKAGTDIKCFWSHDESEILGSTAAGTLKLESRADGLHFSVELPASASGRAETLERGDAPGVSFAFVVDPNGDTWEASERTLRSAHLLEISIGVAFPAYLAAKAEAVRRSKANTGRAAEVRRLRLELALWGE